MPLKASALKTNPPLLRFSHSNAGIKKLEPHVNKRIAIVSD